MKKISLFLMAVVLLSSFVMADEEEHSVIRRLVSPEFSLTEVNENTITGTFKEMSVLIEKNTDKKNPGYTGWIIKDGKKLPISLFYKDKKLQGDFNGTKFAYSKMDVKKKSYTFKTGKGETKVSYLFEYKEGRHQINPLFIAKNNKRNYLVRLEGGCCIGHGLSYAAIIYGLTTFDEVGKRVKGSGDKVENKKKAKEDHKH